MHEAKSETIAFTENNIRKRIKLCLINPVVTLTCALCLPSTIHWIPVPIVLYYVHTMSSRRYCKYKFAIVVHFEQLHPKLYNSDGDVPTTLLLTNIVKYRR